MSVGKIVLVNCKLLQCVELTKQLDCKCSSRVSIYIHEKGVGNKMKGEANA